MTFNRGLSLFPPRFTGVSYTFPAASIIYNPYIMMPGPHQIPSSTEPNHLSLIAFARSFLRTNPSLTSYTCHLLLLDPGLGLVQQAEAYFMLFSTSSDVSWLRAAVDLCEHTPGIRKGLEGSEGFEKWKRIFAELNKEKGEKNVEVKQSAKMEEDVELKVEDIEGVGLENKLVVKREDTRELKMEHEQGMKVEDVGQLGKWDGGIDD
jgi:hypothetical protein